MFVGYIELGFSIHHQYFQFYCNGYNFQVFALQIRLIGKKPVPFFRFFFVGVSGRYRKVLATRNKSSEAQQILRQKALPGGANDR